MSYKTITLRLTPEIVKMVDWLHVQLFCSRQEAIRRCIIYCDSCPDKVNSYIFTRAKLLNCSKEAEK